VKPVIENHSNLPGVPGGSGADPTLPPRLRAVADLVPVGAPVVDVGAGHGLLCLWLLARGRAPGCIATERDRAAGARLVDLAHVPGLDVRFGDGLQVLGDEDRGEVLVISGLGARTMLRILEEAGERVSRLRRLVLQPQTEAGRLRRWIVDRGLTMIEERMTLDRGRFYVTIAAEARTAVRSVSHPALCFDDLMEVGPCLVRSANPLVREYWHRVAARLDRVLERASAGSGRARAVRHRALARRVLAALDSPA
jgi:tRNA (adenine22-N1)-methyltransferase